MHEHGEARRVSGKCAAATRAADRLLQAPLSGRVVQLLMELEPYREAEAAGASAGWMVLDFGEGQRVEVIDAESVRMNPETPFVIPFRSQLALRPARYAEVLRGRVRLVRE